MAGSSLAGCYRFEEPDGAGTLGLPWGIELLEAPLLGWPEQPESFLARTWLTEQQSDDHPFGYWQPVAGDSIRTGYPGGGAGFDVYLARVDGDLEGWGRAVGDVVLPDDPTGPRPAHPVRARRVACPAAA